MFVEREAEIADQVEEEGEDVDGTTTEGVGEGAEDGGRDGLEDYVDC